MAGVKGRSGGARPGAGRKPRPATVIPQEPPKQGVGVEQFDPRPSLELVARGLMEVSPAQLQALKALLPYTHQKMGEGGKKEKRQEAAGKVAGKAGRFSAAAPPRLAAVGGKSV